MGLVLKVSSIFITFDIFDR